MKGLSSQRPRIFYLAPDFEKPSWGIALLYRHVGILRKHGFEAWVLHHRTGFSLSWLEDRPPIRFLDEPGLDLGERDVLVVPEVLTAEALELPFNCRRFVFVQGAFLILKPFEEAISYRELGYERAIAVLPHVKEILERHFDIDAEIVPPFIADYFFAAPQRERKRQILLFPKEGYRDIGYFDFEILRKLLDRLLRSFPDWEILEVRDLPHHEVARLMQTSVFMVNLNCLEAFNTTVPEAMAAGCIPICYEAYGGRDFLINGLNAFVFPNNDLYPLAAKLEELIRNYGNLSGELECIRDEARATAGRFTESVTEAALLEFFTARVHLAENSGRKKKRDPKAPPG